MECVSLFIGGEKRWNPGMERINELFLRELYVNLTSQGKKQPPAKKCCFLVVGDW